MEFCCLGKYTSFVILFIQLAFGLQVEATRQISFKEIDANSEIRHLSPVFANNILEIFEDEKVKYTKLPSIIELISFLIKKQTLSYNKGSKKYEIHPLDKVVEVKNNTRKVLGYFSKITCIRNRIILIYRNGDKSTYGPAYNCKVYLEASSNPSFSTEFKEGPNNLVLNVKTDEFMDVGYEMSYGVLFKNRMHKSILQVVLDEQSKSGKNKRLSPSVLKDIVYGRKKRYVLSKANSTSNIEKDKEINKEKLKLMAESFKSDLEKSRNANKTAIEDIIKKSLMKDVSKKSVKRKHLVKENYETKIISKHPVLKEEAKLNEKVTKSLDLYYNSSGISPSQKNPQPKKTENLESAKENNNEKDEDEAIKPKSPPSSI